MDRPATKQDLEDFVSELTWRMSAMGIIFVLVFTVLVLIVRVHALEAGKCALGGNVIHKIADAPR